MIGPLAATPVQAHAALLVEPFDLFACFLLSYIVTKDLCIHLHAQTYLNSLHMQD